MAAPFVWGSGGRQLTPDQVEAEKKVANALMLRGMDYSPVQHWSQGASRVAQALMGGVDYSMADAAGKRNTAADKDMLTQLLAGGAAPSPTAPVAPPTPASAPPAPAMSSTTNKVYANDEPSPLDPPSGAERDLLVRTVLAEAGNQGPVGQQAVANVVRNRAVAGNFGGDTVPGVVQKPFQFEPHNTPAGRERMAAMDPNSPQFQAATAAVERAYAGDDPTRGATHFYAPKAQAALGRPVPGWAQGQPSQDIGDHRFLGGAGAPPVMAGASPTDVSAQAVRPQVATQPAPANNAAIIGALTNPAASDATKKVATMLLQQRMAGDKSTDEIKEYDLYKKQGGTKSFFDYKVDLKKAGAIQNTVQIDQKGEGEFSKEAGKLQAKRFNDLAEDAPAAKQMLSDVEVLRDLGTKIETGKGAEARAVIGPYAQALGIDVKGLSEIQAYEAVVNRVAPNLRVKGSGAQSDFELKNFLKSIPSIGNTPGGNEIASRVLEGLYQNKLAAAEIGSKALNGDMTRSAAEKAIRDLPDPMKEWREFKKSTAQGWSDMGNGVRIREKR